jgi:uncharacterized damage-inducible protein DinB
MKRILLSTLFLALAAAPLAAQAAEENAAVESSRQLYEAVKDFLIRSAEQMPEAEYAFQPTPEVRTFGQLIGHVANAQYMICATALGETNPNTENIEEARTTKAALQEALRASFAYCDRAYQLTDAAAMQKVNLFGQERTRLGVLNLNVAHDFEHYGNIITYMRLKGLVPPSSQR